MRVLIHALSGESMEQIVRAIPQRGRKFRRPRPWRSFAMLYFSLPPDVTSCMVHWPQTGQTRRVKIADEAPDAETGLAGVRSDSADAGDPIQVAEGNNGQDREA